MKQVIIDAENAVFGRLCSYAAKKALEGNEVVVVNSDKAVITGNRENIIEKYNRLKQKGGHSQKGPKYTNKADRMMKRAIRGMLPDHRWGQGRMAMKKVMCYNGIPKEFAGKEIKKTHAENKIKFMTLKELSERI